jgi:YidC/Oxa1 family membrane protein insertase
MDKNLLLAVVLSVAVYAAWFGLVDKPKPAPAKTEISQTAKPSSGGGGTAAPAPAASAAPAAAKTSEAAAKELLAQADKFEFEGQTWRIHPRGAALVSAEYQGPLGNVELVHDPKPGIFATFPELLFKRDVRSSLPVYEAQLDGLRLIKEFLPGTQKELPRLRLRLINPGKRTLPAPAWTLHLGPGLGTVPSEKKENESVWRALALLPAEGGGHKGKLEIFSKPAERTAPYRWVGIDNRYFLAAVLPPSEGLDKVTAELPPHVSLRLKSSEIPPGGEHVHEFPFYLGAKANNKLTAYGSGLERAIDFGFFAQLGRWTVQALGKLHTWTGNWGWSIVLLTLILQVILFPLTYKSLKAAAAMKKVQPELARLQQKWGKDPAKLNAEMMELYKKSGANPLGGCLPMLLQMPIFIALFNALRNSWELHGAAWIFWITDLSSKDPYYVLPIIMGALMVLQQKMQPAATADPMQAKMMMWMPVIFTFMFLNFSSGLVLYWTINSVVSSVLQVALKGHFEKAA